jgi:hypothetical protein
VKEFDVVKDIPMLWRILVLLLLAVSVLSGCAPFSMEDAEEDLDARRIYLSGNFDARQPTFDQPFDVDDPSSTSQLSAVIGVLDENNRMRDVSLYFRKEEPSQFGFYVLSSELDSRQASIVLLHQGRLLFDTDGALLDVSPSETFFIHFEGDENPVEVALDFGTPKGHGSDGLDGCTQFALDNSIDHHRSRKVD